LTWLLGGWIRMFCGRMFRWIVLLEWSCERAVVMRIAVFRKDRISIWPDGNGWKAASSIGTLALLSGGKILEDIIPPEWLTVASESA
jgi:hypothetical protein